MDTLVCAQSGQFHIVEHAYMCMDIYLPVKLSLCLCIIVILKIKMSI